MRKRCAALFFSRRLIVLAAFLGTLSSAATRAANPTPAPAPDHPKAEEPADAAKRLYREGSAEYSLGNYAAAKDKFEAAFRAKQVTGLLFNIAQCYRQLRNFELAATTYKSFIRLDPSNPQVELAKQLLKQVEDAMHTQEKAQTAPPLDANGTDAFKLKTNLDMQPSPPVARTENVPPPIAVVAAPPPRKSNHVIAWCAGGAGVAAAGTGLVLGLQSKSAQNALAAGGMSRSATDSDVSKVQRDATLGNVLIIAGATLLVGAGAAWFLGAP